MTDLDRFVEWQIVADVAVFVTDSFNGRSDRYLEWQTVSDGWMTDLGGFL